MNSKFLTRRQLIVGIATGLFASLGLKSVEMRLNHSFMQQNATTASLAEGDGVEPGHVLLGGRALSPGDIHKIGMKSMELEPASSSFE